MANGCGGARPNSGRKRKPVKILKKATAEQVLDQIDELQGWKWAWQTAKAKEDIRTAVEILSYLTNRRDGKPAQAIRTENVDLNALFDRMSAIELERYAESGTLPDWFQVSAEGSYV
jgi:hypothetical protein